MRCPLTLLQLTDEMATMRKDRDETAGRCAEVEDQLFKSKTLQSKSQAAVARLEAQVMPA